VKTLELSVLVERAVADGLAAAAVANRFGQTLALAGALDSDEVRPIAGLVTHRLKSEGIGRRLFAGQMVEFSLDERNVSIGIAAQFVFVVVVFAEVTEASRERARTLRREVEQVLAGTDLVGAPPWARGGGGSSSGPAVLPVIEIGLTVPRREHRKA
jgi:hypothetical protein